MQILVEKGSIFHRTYQVSVHWLHSGNSGVCISLPLAYSISCAPFTCMLCVWPLSDGPTPSLSSMLYVWYHSPPVPNFYVIIILNYSHLPFMPSMLCVWPSPIHPAIPFLPVILILCYPYSASHHQSFSSMLCVLHLLMDPHPYSLSPNFCVPPTSQSNLVALPPMMCVVLICTLMHDVPVWFYACTLIHVCIRQVTEVSNVPVLAARNGHRWCMRKIIQM